MIHITKTVGQTTEATASTNYRMVYIYSYITKTITYVQVDISTREEILVSSTNAAEPEKQHNKRMTFAIEPQYNQAASIESYAITVLPLTFARNRISFRKYWTFYRTF